MSGLVRGMGEEGGDLPLGVVGGSGVAEGLVGAGCGQEGVAGVEALAGAPAVGLADDPIEEALRHDVGHRDVVGGGIARSRLAPVAAVVVAGAAVAVLAAAEVGRAAAILGGHRDGSGQEEAQQKHRVVDRHCWG
ncbi:hypothetical protein C4D60_Mb05t17700 [Musa balbisiana]|uniref:Uncharacterized protein n=1 Tax=Musa balbisiana TaxID=52838 RepID=A0A4S8JWW6_MUSBA|nr:hypothetical protein C4D60_Mb05t17700 [Musa balbisiana]